MKSRLPIATLALCLSMSVGTAPRADEGVVRSYQVSEQSLFSIGPGTRACKPDNMVSGTLIPNVRLDSARACNNAPETYLYKKEVVDVDGRRTVTTEVRNIRDTYEETAAISPDGTESLSVTISTSGPSLDTNKAVVRNLSISELTNIFGSADTASKLRETVSRGLAAPRRAAQEPVDASQTPAP